MTTYNVSGTATTSGGSSTQNVTTADSVVVTVSNSVNGTMTISTNNCTSNTSSISSGGSATITFSSTGSYNATFSHTTSSKEPELYYFQLSGTVSAAATAYSVTSGAISMDGVRDFLTTASSNEISMDDFYKGGSLVPNISENSGVPTSGTIDLGDLYGVYKT